MTLFSRLLSLGSGPQPAVELSGACTAIRDTGAKLTKAGEEFLAGARSYVQLNGINEWVAGVHLDSSANRVWYRDDEGGLRGS
ncbi:MAG: hypothetical protein HOW73_46095 [Polyangiaceae bacterium]|nr:hypothetical protein [Polyangiaceae bacterium]